MTVFGKLGRTACSAVVAFGMCWPAGLAPAEEGDLAGDGEPVVQTAEFERDAAVVEVTAPGAVALEAGDVQEGDSQPGDRSQGADGDGGQSGEPDADASAGDGASPVDDGLQGGVTDEEADASGEPAADQADKADEADKAPVAAAVVAAIAQARAAVGEADQAASRLPGLLSELEAGKAAFEAGGTALAEDVAARDAAEQALANATAVEEDARLAYAKAQIDAISENAGELLPDPKGEPDDFAESEAHVRVKDAVGSLVAARSDHEAKLRDASTLRDKVSDATASFRFQTESAASAAFDVETACSDMRLYDRQAEEALAGLPDGAEGVAEAREEIASSQSRHDAARASAQDACASWYELSERVAGAEGALTFGAGVDFALPEGEFVATWGAAIDRFLSGRGAALAGYGEAMARSAYKWRIDPRLCAAVSITESSGGLYCIRPHNAWGWGAADSDPYNLAWEWSSWEEAIEAWHQGVATNSAGLAAARSLSAFGEIYASSPSWAASTAKSMRQITL